MEIKRQLSHLVLGVLFLVLIYFDIMGVRVLLIIFIIGFILSLICLKHRVLCIGWLLDKFEREGNYPGKGALFFVLGCLIVVSVFSKDIALGSIAILTIGDSVSHLYGRYFGRLKNPLNRKKAIEGSVFGIILSGLVASLFVPVLNAFVASFIAMIVEAIELSINKRAVDDNLVVPIVSGAVLFLMSLIV
jgi:phytol kinase